MFWQRVLAASLLASGAQAGIGGLVMEGMTRNSPSVERRMQEIAKASLVARGFLQARETTGLGSNTVLNPDGSINMTAWDAQANSACNDALGSLSEATNPSGTCICYNLPALDNSTGTFEADLRLYQLNTPTGAFSGVPPENIQVGLSYRGASVSPVTSQTASQKVVVPKLSARQTDGNGLKLLQTYLFVGQIDQTQMTPGMTMAQLEALVMPTVTLSAVNGQGQTISTNVSSNEAAFVAGVFSQSVVMSTTAMAQLAVDAEVAGLKNGTVAFVLPGVQILIFPIGLVITGVWTVLGVAAYAAGTVARYNFAVSYRRRMAMAQKANIARI